MKKIEEFYVEKCFPHSENDEMVWLETDSKQIEINKKDKDQQFLEMQNLVRYASPKTDINKLFFNKIDVSKFTDDFDAELSEIERDSQPYKQDLVKNKNLYFLPTHLEKVIKDIVCNNRRKRIPGVLKRYISNDISLRLDLKYLNDEDVREKIPNDQIEEYATSFYKVFSQNNDECNALQIQQNVSYIRRELHADFLEVFDYYFVGQIPMDSGLIQKNRKATYPNPRTFHYNFWILKGLGLLDQIADCFEPCPFEDNLCESEIDF